MRFVLCPFAAGACFPSLKDGKFHHRNVIDRRNTVEDINIINSRNRSIYMPDAGARRERVLSLATHCMRSCTTSASTATPPKAALQRRVIDLHGKRIY